MPNTCPKCDSGDIEGHEDDEEYGRWDAATKRFVSDVIRLPISCNDCYFKWIEVFEYKRWIAMPSKELRQSEPNV